MGFFSDFSGSSARKDIRASSREANGYVDKGYATSDGLYADAAGMFDPFVAAGGKANDTYNALLGLSGNAARDEANTMLTSNPLFQGQLGQESNALLRNLNARGASGGGQAQIAGQRVFQQNVGNWLDRYRDAGRDGYAATAAKAGVTTARGDNAYGYGATKAGIATNTGNAIADTRGMGVNNLLKLAGTAISGYNALRPQPTRAYA